MASCTTLLSGTEILRAVRDELTNFRLGVVQPGPGFTIVENREVSEKLFSKLLPRMKERPGGYTRVLKTSPRQGDGAPMVLVELVD